MIGVFLEDIAQKALLEAKRKPLNHALLDRVPLELLILSDALFMFQRIFVLSQLIFDVLQSDVNTRKCLIDAGQIDIDFN